MNEPKQWTQAEAIELCKKIEAICPTFGCHVALTGGMLYKDGPRNDLVILFYRIRQVADIDFDGLWKALEAIGLYKKSGFGWCYKAEYWPKETVQEWYNVGYVQPGGTRRRGVWRKG